MSRFPTIRAAELVRFFKAHGYLHDRQHGSHVILRNPATGQTVSVPVHTGYDLGRGLALQVLKQAGFKGDDFLKWR